MAVREIMLLGNPVLRAACTPVRRVNTDESRGLVSDLADTLHRFRSEHGFGRGISAPQIGVTQRVIFLDTEYRGPLFNPRIVRKSRGNFQLWDDCFSFPDILVRLNRNASVVVEYDDEHGKGRTLKAEGALSELLQHEIDHVNGILAVDRAIDTRHIILRSELGRLTAHTSVAL